MLDIKYIIENREEVERSIELRHFKTDLDAVIDAYDRFRSVKQALEENRPRPIRSQKPSARPTRLSVRR